MVIASTYARDQFSKDSIDFLYSLTVSRLCAKRIGIFYLDAYDSSKELYEVGMEK